MQQLLAKVLGSKTYLKALAFTTTSAPSNIPKWFIATAQLGLIFKHPVNYIIHSSSFCVNNLNLRVRYLIERIPRFPTSSLDFIISFWPPRPPAYIFFFRLYPGWWNTKLHTEVFKYSSVFPIKYLNIIAYCVSR